MYSRSPKERRCLLKDERWESIFIFPNICLRVDLKGALVVIVDLENPEAVETAAVAIANGAIDQIEDQDLVQIDNS